MSKIIFFDIYDEKTEKGTYAYYRIRCTFYSFIYT